MRARLPACVRTRAVASSLGSRALPARSPPQRPGPSSNPGLQTEPRGSSHGRGVLTAQCFVLLGEEDGRDQAKLETKVWEVHNPLVDKQIDQFLVVAR